MAKFVRDTAAAKSISAWIITDKKGNLVAKVQAHYGNNGNVLVNAWDLTKNEDQFYSDKGNSVESALAGYTIAGYTLADHSSNRNNPKVPKGRITYPENFKLPKGFHLANFGTYDKTTKANVTAYDVKHGDYKEEFQAWEPSEDFTGKRQYAAWKNSPERLVFALVQEFIREKIQQGKFEQGYSSCFQDAGLKYLEAQGFSVFQAI